MVLFPFQQLTLNPPDVFKLGITRGSNEEAYFKYHEEDYFRKIYRVNLKIHLVDGFQKGMQHLIDKLVLNIIKIARVVKYTR